MDRSIVYPGAIPLDTDLLNVNRNAMVALGALAQAVLGTSTVVDGLMVIPTTPASMQITVGPGTITSQTTVDQNAYGSLSADTGDALLKMGVNLAATSFSLTAPSTTGQSISYLVEAAFLESDTNPVVLPYYNAANPAVPYLGPSNSGAAQATNRIQRVQFQLKAGSPALTGSQITPTVDSGWSGLAVITVSYGQTQIIAANIAAHAQAPGIPFKLPTLRPGFSQMQAFTASGSFTVPVNVTRIKVTVIGGGGAGGSNGSCPGGGGGAGGSAIAILTSLTPGAIVPITVGAGGTASASSTGSSGGTSSFGTYASATGGTGGVGGSSYGPMAGGQGGAGVGGTINNNGSYGTDCVLYGARGGDGGGPGNGRGTTGALTGIAAQGYGGGGGGGGSNSTTGAGIGALGGAGAAGIVIVEY
jgi:hypothetical protein